MRVAEPVLAPWKADLALGFSCRNYKSLLTEKRSDGPLVVQKPLYPEGDAVCHAIVVHPPGGIAGGDELHLKVKVDPQSAALLTTPGAGKWYRSAGAWAQQSLDFKVAGTREGVTSIQMDIKVERLDWKVIAEALEKAKKARLHILDVMQQTMAQPRSQLSKYAPRILTIQIRPDKIGDVIGPKGKTIRGIQEQTGAEINVDDTGLVTISGVGEAAERARDMVSGIVQEPEVGKVYEGVVKSTTAFGAFVEIIPGVEGLLHISELQHGRTEKTEDVVKKGDHLKVKLLEVDERGRMRLSRKALLEKN